MTRILLAEDDESLRGFLARALEMVGYEVTACADGDEAAAALDGAWDLLLTDIVMPGMDGIEVGQQQVPGAVERGRRLVAIGAGGDLVADPLEGAGQEPAQGFVVFSKQDARHGPLIAPQG